MKNKYLNAKDLVFFCEEMAILLQSGIPYQEGLSIIEEDLSNVGLKKKISKLRQSVGVDSLAQAMEKVGDFPPYMTSMVKVGESTGCLDEVMTALSVYYRRNDSVENAVRSAVVYPFIMALMMFSVVLVVIVKVLPLFYQVLQGFVGEMSALSLALMHFGIAMSKNTAVITVIVVVCLLAALLFILVPAIREQGKRCLIALFHKTSQRVFLANFSAAMAMMLKSGMNFDVALSMAKDVVKDRHFGEKIDAVRGMMEQGMSFSDAMTKGEIFSRMQSAMLSLSLRTGNVEKSMDMIAETYNKEAEAQISSAVSIVEPIIVGIFSLVIAAILLSVILPLMGVMSAL